MTVLSVVGARPQFIKSLPVSVALRAVGLEEILVHTGQHYDNGMSDVFFENLALRKPAHHLGVGSAGHGAQTGRMLERMEEVLQRERPAAVVVYGDTNSTLAGALSAAKLNIPVAHVEAGLRSFRRDMPEEINRVLTDQLSTLLFAPTEAAVRNLRSEGLEQGIFRTGDVMLDAVLLLQRELRDRAAEVLASFSVTPGGYAFATVHRAENTDDPDRWQSIIEGLSRVGREVAPVLWPVHPRARHLLRGDGSNVRWLDPIPYLETQALVMNARVVLTDSGGLQKEAAFHRTPCVTLREETEWVELVEHGVNVLAGADADRIVESAKAARWPAAGLPNGLYGNGHSAEVRSISRRSTCYASRWII